MSFLDLFRNFLGLKRRNEPGTSGLGNYDSNRDSFRNPIWQNDEDEDDDIDDFRHPRNGMHFNIFSDPLEITRYFETQMDNMLKDFVGPENKNFFFFENNIGNMPQIEDNLRDKMLKSDSGSLTITEIPPEEKMDVDLDGKVTVDEISKTLKGNDRNVEVRKSIVPHIRSFGKSVRREIVRRPDGTIEQKQTIRDSEGNEQITISRDTGNKRHVITTKKDQNGVETSTEDFIDINGSEQKDLIQSRTFIPDIADGHDALLNNFPWEKFFGPRL